MTELERQDSPPDLGLIKVKDEPVDIALQHPETIFAEDDTKAKDEDGIIELPVSRDAPTRPERSRKRQQVIVLLPTLAEIRNRRKKSADDDDIEKLKKLFKPKKKKTELSLDEKILISRLKPIGLDPFAVDLPRAEVNQMVSRWFMSSIYGGSMQATFPQIGAKKLAEHGMDDFMYLHLKYHPYAPQCPGGGGLWFNPEWYGDPWQGVHRVFTRDRTLAMWQYMGQYDIRATASLTLAEWLGLGNIRYNWAREICAKEWGSGVRARIQARKEVGPGREPTREEVTAVLHSGRSVNTTPEDVRIAFDCGKERMGVWTMKCIEYDYPFQLELYDKYPNWTPPESSKRKGKLSKKIKEDVKVEVKAEDGKIPPAKAPRGKKRKRTATPDSETCSEAGTDMWTKDEAKVMEMVDDEEQVIFKIRSRGTKSRPIHL